MSGRIVVCEDLDLASTRFRSEGFRLDIVYPADDPHTAVLSRGSEIVRLTTRPDAPAPSRELPPFVPEFVLTRSGGDSGKGRAGMNYRDLIPGRLGGRYIASHITIDDGGPVSDWVHYHRVAFQMIFVRTGWVRVVYEDQGEPFVMESGDMVLQPPGIRHRVLESSPGLEVIEISAPALHETLADHDMSLPTDRIHADRDFAGQRFLRHVSTQMPWTAVDGSAHVQLTSMHDATGGLADVTVWKLDAASALEFAPHHRGELVFGFVLSGSAHLDYRAAGELCAGDAFVIPPKERWGLGGASDDFRLLRLTSGRLG